MKIESILYDKLDDKKVRCEICSHYCLIDIDKRGFCLTRKNEGGTLYNNNFALLYPPNIDPIEKQPFFNFLPDSKTYSLGGFECNMRCLNCQNHSVSQSYGENIEAIEILPEEAVKNAIDSDCKSIAWTYTEPTIHLEYVLETSKLSHESGLKNVYVSNGYMTDVALDLLLPHIDAFNIDLKSMSNDFYDEICQATLNPVLNNLKKIYKSDKHLEITNLLIEGYNDSEKEITELVDFVSCELGEEVPINFSKFLPHYYMGDVPPTSIETLKKAKQIAIAGGLQYVYLGNVYSDQNTFCPNCGELLIERIMYKIIDKNRIKNNKCNNCDMKLNFNF